MNVQYGGGSRSFGKDTRAWRWVQWLAVGNRQWLAETTVKADPLMATQEVAKELSIDHSMVIWHLKQIGKVKRLDRWVSHELIENEKNRSFEMSSSLNLCINSEPFLNRIVTLWWKVDFIQQLAMTSLVVRPRRSSKMLCKANLASEKVVVPVGWSAADLIHYSFLNPSENSEKYTQQIDEMHQKL